MNITRLNTLNDDKVIVRGNGGNSGGGGNSGEGGTTPSKPKWTGHADAEGLKAIGWTDEDIAYYQAHGVNWNEEDDEYHKVSDDNKALYGVLTADNIQDYKDRIVYLPKIDISGIEFLDDFCYESTTIKAVPSLNYEGCVDISYSYSNAYNLNSISPLRIPNTTTIYCTFGYSPKLEAVCLLETFNLQIMESAFAQNYSLKEIHIENVQSIEEATKAFWKCYSLERLFMKNLHFDIDLRHSPFLRKESIIYLTDNESATSAITITLHSYAYERLANDADVVAALAAHPNISISQ